MPLKKDLLEELPMSDMFDQIGDLEHKKGLYNNMFYIVRLRRDVRDLVSKIRNKTVGDQFTSLEQHQALSTLYHENWHWWQYIGSTSGLIASLSFPSQITTSITNLEKHLKLTGKVKPIVSYAEKKQSHKNDQSEEFKIINKIINSTKNIHFYLKRVKRPSETESFINDSYFRSIGLSYAATYISTVRLIKTIFDKDSNFLPDTEKWVVEVNRLQKSNTKGFSIGEDILVPHVGTWQLYEGQARFNQLLYLHFASEKIMNWDDFKKVGMIEGEYYLAFQVFLDILGERRPDSIDSSLVALYLLLIDIAINPCEGFPFEINKHEDFVQQVDPGFRFENLCKAVRDAHPDFKYVIKEYSPKYYRLVSDALCKTIGYHTPTELSKKILLWLKDEKSVKKLFKENIKFSYSKGNTLTRMVLGKFLSFQKDKAKNPEFFCWPGVYMLTLPYDKSRQVLNERHFSLFREDSEGRISPSQIKKIHKDVILKTSAIIYQELSFYEICRQWILVKGKFNYRFEWINENMDIENVIFVTNANFMGKFSVNLDGFSEN